MIGSPDRQMLLFPRPERLKRRTSFPPRFPMEQIEEGRWLYRGKEIELFVAADNKLHAQVSGGFGTGGFDNGLEAIHSAQQMINREIDKI